MKGMMSRVMRERADDERFGKVIGPRASAKGTLQ